MDDESDTSDSYLVIRSNKDRVKLFCRIYWRVLVMITTAVVLFPITFIGNNYAYPCFYIFLLTAIYWIFDVLHPSVIALIPTCLFTLMGYVYKNFVVALYIRNTMLSCLGVMIIMVAIEYSRLHKRVALKVLLIVGCSHYKLSFVLFFSCMFLAMFLTNTLACGVMMPIVKAILYELEKMGILEIYHSIGKIKQSYSRHEESMPRPTDFTVFYFLGIAYSSSIGGMATLIGCQANEIFKYYSAQMFPFAPKLDFPHFMLLNLPGALLMESLLYLWMNFYFMGMFRAQSEMALEIGMSEEEAQYIHTLLSTEYYQLGKIKCQEIVVIGLLIITMILLTTKGFANSEGNISSPIIVCALLFFLLPAKLDFLNFFKKTTINDPLPTGPSKGCLNWKLMSNNIHWSVLFTIAGGCTIIEGLRASDMTEELEKFFLLLRGWPAPAQALVVIIVCKLLAECCSNSCVVFVMLPHIAKVSMVSKVNPHYLMAAATLASSLPFHLVSGTAANAMVVDYVRIPPWKMMHAGLGPSLIAIVVIWFTVTLWSKAIWPDINIYPYWAEDSRFNYYSSNHVK